MFLIDSCFLLHSFPSWCRGWHSAQCRPCCGTTWGLSTCYTWQSWVSALPHASRAELTHFLSQCGKAHPEKRCYRVFLRFHSEEWIHGCHGVQNPAETRSLLRTDAVDLTLSSAWQVFRFSVLLWFVVQWRQVSVNFLCERCSFKIYTIL